MKHSSRPSPLVDPLDPDDEDGYPVDDDAGEDGKIAKPRKPTPEQANGTNEA